MGIFKKANNIYITVRDTYTSISGSSYEEAEEVIIEATNGDLELISQKKVIMQGLGKEDEEQEIKQSEANNSDNEPDFFIHFRLPKKYDGEFGFDWMRDNYKEICNDYEALKKEYYDAEKKEKVEIEGQEYFVPWLSMFPNQKGVKLKLEVEKIDNFKPKAGDFIEILPKNEIRFEPNKLEISKISENTMIEVFCDTPLQNDITIDVKNNKGNIVGKLNFAKNNEAYKLPIQFVKVFADKGNETNNRRAFEDLTPVTFEEIKKDLQNKYFNQALIQFDFLDIKEITINIEEFKNKKCLSYVTNEETGLIESVRALGGFDRTFYNKYFESFKGIIIILSAVFRDRDGAGFGIPFPLNVNFLFIAPNVGKDKIALTLAHELGHTLGLYHSSEAESYFEAQKRIQHTNKEKIMYEGNTYTREEYIKKATQDLESIYPKFIFSGMQTDNIMESNDSVSQKSFWRWQCQRMQKEIKSYHNEK